MAFYGSSLVLALHTQCLVYIIHQIPVWPCPVWSSLGGQHYRAHHNCHYNIMPGGFHCPLPSVAPQELTEAACEEDVSRNAIFNTGLEAAHCLQWQPMEHAHLMLLIKLMSYFHHCINCVSPSPVSITKYISLVNQ